MTDSQTEASEDHSTTMDQSDQRRGDVFVVVPSSEPGRFLLENTLDVKSLPTVSSSSSKSQGWIFYSGTEEPCGGARQEASGNFRDPNGVHESGRSDNSPDADDWIIRSDTEEPSDPPGDFRADDTVSRTVKEMSTTTSTEFCPTDDMRKVGEIGLSSINVEPIDTVHQVTASKYMTHLPTGNEGKPLLETKGSDGILRKPFTNQSSKSSIRLKVSRDADEDSNMLLSASFTGERHSWECDEGGSYSAGEIHGSCHAVASTDSSSEKKENCSVVEESGIDATTTSVKGQRVYDPGHCFAQTSEDTELLESDRDCLGAMPCEKIAADKGNKSSCEKDFINSVPKPKPVYPCHVCNNLFQSKEELLDHVAGHTAKDKFTGKMCPVCLCSLRARCEKTDYHETPWRCLNCLIVYPSQGLFTAEHTLSTCKESVKRSLCRICRKLFTAKHLKDNDDAILSPPTEPTVNASAGKTDISNKGSEGSEFQGHTAKMVLLDIKMFFVCKVCSNRFRQKAKMIEHMKTEHGEEELYKGDFCQGCFVSLRGCTDRNEHIPSRCSRCSKVFPDKSSLLRHRQTSNCWRETHSCSVCLKRFVISKHDIGSKRVGCPLCAMDFKFVSDLRKHMHRHRKPKHACPNCSKAFTEKWRMQRHKRQFCKESNAQMYPMTLGKLTRLHKPQEKGSSGKAAVDDCNDGCSIVHDHSHYGEVEWSVCTGQSASQPFISISQHHRVSTADRDPRSPTSLSEPQNKGNTASKPFSTIQPHGESSAERDSASQTSLSERRSKDNEHFDETCTLKSIKISSVFHDHSHYAPVKWAVSI